MDDGNYCELWWFMVWMCVNEVEEFTLSESCARFGMDGKMSVVFGDGVVVFDDVGLGCEMCEELWMFDVLYIVLVLNGIEIVSNGSGSYY